MDVDKECDCISDTQNVEEKQLFHVLAVDDSNIDRKLLERLLTVSSYQVTCVDSGDKALEYLGLVDVHEISSSSSSAQISSQSSSTNTSNQELMESSYLSAKSYGVYSHEKHNTMVSKVNLIMTDYSMPGITGYDLLKRIKDSSWKDVPVVVMSSENVPSRINMCLEGGAEEFLVKPVKLSDLRKLHSHLLNHENINKEDTGNDTNCSNANKRKANLATSSDLSDRRIRVQELPVS